MIEVGQQFQGANAALKKAQRRVVLTSMLCQGDDTDLENGIQYLGQAVASNDNGDRMRKLNIAIECLEKCEKKANYIKAMSYYALSIAYAYSGKFYKAEQRATWAENVSEFLAIKNDIIEEIKKRVPELKEMLVISKQIHANFYPGRYAWEFFVNGILPVVFFIALIVTFVIVIINS